MELALGLGVILVGALFLARRPTSPSPSPSHPAPATSPHPGIHWPPVEGRITSGWGEPRPGGRLHEGIDFAAPTGSPVRAVFAGEVLRVVKLGEKSDAADLRAGTFVVVGRQLGTDRNQGLFGWYMHLSSVAVRTGERVTAGQVIGAVGSTGVQRSAPHLHFQTGTGPWRARGYSRTLHPPDELLR